MHRIISVNRSSDFVPKGRMCWGAQLAQDLWHNQLGTLQCWFEQFPGVDGKCYGVRNDNQFPWVNEPICLPWNNGVHREWNCNFKKFNTVRASTKIPFRLIKWLCTLTNGKDFSSGVLLLIGEFPFSHNPQNPLFRGAASGCSSQWLCTFAAQQNPIQQLERKHSSTKLTSKWAGGTLWGGTTCSDPWCKGRGEWRKGLLLPERCQGGETTHHHPLPPWMGCKKTRKTLQKLFYTLK